MISKLAVPAGFLAATFAVAACAHNPAVEAGGEVVPATPVGADWLPVGTTLNVRLNQSLGTSMSHEGDQFTATVIDPVVAQNGQTAVPAGATVSGHVTGLHSSSIPGERGVIRLDFDRLTMNGRSYPFDGSIASVNVQNQSSAPSTNSTVRGAVTGAAAGAALGAIISGLDLSKIITGGLLGAAAGTVISLGTGGTQSTIPAGSTMQVRATQAVQVR